VPTKKPSHAGGVFCETKILRYVFALAGIGFFLSRFATFWLLTTLLLPALLFFFPALLVRRVALLTLVLATLLLVHATLFTFHCHSLVSILDCYEFGAAHQE
jgi:hypothetical protein